MVPPLIHLVGSIIMSVFSSFKMTYSMSRFMLNGVYFLIQFLSLR